MRDPFAKRTIHLDFHTSPHISDVGADFNAEAFAATLADAHVDSVTLFAKCHHGHLYYATDRPERHPGLPRELDLLGEQIEALRRKGIRTPIYMSVLIDEYAANLFPQWCVIDEENRRLKRRAGLFEAGWQVLDMSSPYQDYLADQLDEVLHKFTPIDGLFLDMCWDQRSCSPWAMAAMLRKKLDPASDADRRRYAREVTLAYMARFKKMVDQAHTGKDKPGVWFNSRSKAALFHERRYVRHIEVECLPGGGWGYAYLPYIARLVEPIGLPVASHTARFHKGWGDFGTVKNEAAMKYECCRMLSLGLSCGVGDQMHPRGSLDPQAYNLIGKVYRHVMACEPWQEGGRLASEAVVLFDQANGDRPGSCGLGYTRLLQEQRIQFALSRKEELKPNQYALVIIPENIKVDESLRDALRLHIQLGGGALFSGESALDAEGNPLLPEMGIQVHGPSPYTVTYLRPTASLAQKIGQQDWAMFEPGFRMTPTGTAHAACQIVEPYFERQYDHFCSHAQTPPATLTRFAGVVRQGRVVTFSMPLFTAYAKHGNAVYRKLLGAMVEQLLPDPIIRCGGPVHLEATCLRSRKRTCVHLLSFLPACRTEDRSFDTVEDPFPVIDMPLSIRLERKPRRVMQLPGCVEMPFDYHDGRVRLLISFGEGHAMIVCE